MTAAPPDLRHLADLVVDLIGARAEANVRAVRTRNGLARIANSTVHQHVGEDSTTVSATIAVGGRVASFSTTATTAAALRQEVDRAIAGARLQPPDALWPGPTPPLARGCAGPLDGRAVDSYPDRLAALARAFVAAGDGTRAAGYAESEARWVAFASSAGHRLRGSAARATLDGLHEATRAGEPAGAVAASGAAHQTARSLAGLDGHAAGEHAAALARASASARADVEPSTYEVVLGPDAVATILGYLGVYGFSAARHLDGTSPVRLGEPQFDPCLTVHEDAGDERSVALPLDAEGVPRQRVALVEAGVSRSLLHDRWTAVRAGATSTGNAVPGARHVGPLPASMVVTPGRVSPEDLVASVRRGLLITRFHYVRIHDPRRLDATGLTRDGTFLVEDGRVAGSTGDLRFTQSLLGALAPGRVLGIADDDRHANGEFGPGVVIAPSIHLAAWDFRA